MIKKKIMFITCLILLSVAMPLSTVSAKPSDDKVVLVYKTTLHADVHKENASDSYWRYYVDTYKYYNIIEFDPVNRTFGEEYVLHYYGKSNKIQEQQDGMKYEELKKYDTKNKAYMKGTLYTTSKDKNFGEIRMKYGLVNLDSKIDIGWTEGKVAVALKLRDKIVNREATNWKKYSSKSFSCKLDKIETRNANQEGKTAKEVFEEISQRLYEQGYEPKLTIK